MKAYSSPARKKRLKKYTYIGVRFPKPLDARVRLLAQKAERSVAWVLGQCALRQLPEMEREADRKIQTGGVL